MYSTLGGGGFCVVALLIINFLLVRGLFSPIADQYVHSCNMFDTKEIKLTLDSPSIRSKTEVPRDVLNSNSGNMTSSGENDLNIRTNASPKWDRTRCPEELASSVGWLHPLQMFYGNPPDLVNKVKVGIRSSLVTRSRFSKKRLINGGFHCI